MESGKKPQLVHLVIALESVVLLAFLVMLTPWGSRLTLSGNAVGAETGRSTGENAGGSGAGQGAGGGADAAGGSGSTGGQSGGAPEKDYIKWVDFGVTEAAMKKAFRYDIDTCLAEIHLNWIEILAYLGAKYGGDFSRYRDSDADTLAERLKAGEKIGEITADMKYYAYYLEAYTAVLGGMVGQFEVEIPGSQAPAFALPKDEAGIPIPTEEPVWVTKYGLKAFSPIAKNYPYTDYDDFGASRDYGYRRTHLGHDLMGQVGTPVIAVESGYVEAIGWNQYGGWRLGIRSFDGKRYYYYAHLRKNYPYHKSLKEGSVVQAGDVIGYLGRTGYSTKENTNNIDEAHLHFGLQLIFDESQKDSGNEIWIDCYELVKFLSSNRAETVKDQETKEYYRAYQMKDPAIPGEIPEQRIPAEQRIPVDPS